MRLDSARVARYLATASAAAAGAAAGSAEAVVVTSASVGWTGWSSSITAVTNVGHTNNNWGMNPLSALSSKLIGSIASSLYTVGVRLRAASIRCANNVSIHANRLNTGAVIGAGIAGGFGPRAWLAHSYGNANNGAFSDGTPGFGWLASGAGADSQTGYVGFRLVKTIGVPNQYYYGYFEVTVSRTSGLFSTLSMSITGWAYDNTLNQAITIPAPSAVPGGAGLAALACGAAGLRGRRRVA